MGTWSSREDIAHNVAMSWDESDVDNTEKLAGTFKRSMEELKWVGAFDVPHMLPGRSHCFKFSASAWPMSD